MLQWIENSLYSFSYLTCNRRFEHIEINVTELFNSNSNTWKEELKKHKTKKPFKIKSEASTNIFSLAVKKVIIKIVQNMLPISLPHDC